MMMRLLMTILKMDLTRVRSVVMQRFSFVGNKLGETVYNISGLTHAASIKQTTRSLRKLSRRCFAGTGMLQGATCTYQTFQLGNATTTGLNRHGNPPFGKADGSHGAGRFKNYLP